MKRYLLDTNIFIAAIKGANPVRRQLEQVDAAALVLSPIVLGELLLGVEKSRMQASNRERLLQVVGQFAVAPIDADVSDIYGQIRAQLESRGQTIGANDFWIAAQVLAHQLILVTDNVREFRRVDGLEVENWLRPDQRPR